MTEQKLWQQIRPRFSHHVDWHRVENLVGAGAPDTNGCRYGVEAWVELKIFKGNKIYFRPSQPQWIRRRTAHGGRVWILCYSAAIPENTTSNRHEGLVLYNGNIVPLLLQSGVAAIDGIASGRADTKKVTELATLVLTSTPGTSTMNFSELESTIFG